MSLGETLWTPINKQALNYVSASKQHYSFPAFAALCTFPGAAGEGRNLCWQPVLPTAQAEPPTCSDGGLCSRQRRGGSAAPARPDSGCPVTGTRPGRHRRTAQEPPCWQRPGLQPRPVSSQPSGKAPQLGQQTRSSALEGEKPGQCSPWGPAASSVGRAASCGQQKPESASISPSLAPRLSSNPQAGFLTKSVAHMFVVSKCPFSILGHF